MIPTAVAHAPAHTSSPAHQRDLGEDWGLWRWSGLRATGFPLRLILDLASPRAAAAADRVIEAEDAVLCARSAALNALWRARASERPELKSARRRLEKGKPVELPPGTPGADLAGAHATAMRVAADARGELLAALVAETASLSRHIRSVAADPRFREAVAWQNRHALNTGIDALLRADGAAVTRKDRQHEALVVRYLQRYCTKNDTLGFFGPVGWARWIDADRALMVRPGKTPLASRTTYFESWGIETLAARLAEHADVRQWLPPRRLPFVRVEQAAARDPRQGSIALAPIERAVLILADGERTPVELAADLSPVISPVPDEQQVLAALDRLAARGLINWTFEIPSDAYPECALRHLLGRVDDEALRAELMAPLDALEQRRSAVERAAGDPARVDSALRDLEETFVGITGAAPTREAGRMYAARTLVYEDCRRNVDVKLGTELLDRLREPLRLVLASARWFTTELAARYRQAFGELFQRLARQAGSESIDGVTFWYAAQPLLFGERTRPIEPAIAELQSRWATIWGLPASRRRIDADVARIADAVHAAFAAPPANWPSGCYHSPDVLIAATGPDAIRRGDYTLVLGEFHALLNTLSTSLFLRQHPEPAALFGAAEADRPKPVVIPVAPRNWPGLTARTDAAIVCGKDVRLESAADAIAWPRHQALAIADLVVERHDGDVIVRTIDRTRVWEVVDFFGTTLATIVAPRFHLFGRFEHMPRITLDRLVIAREAWRLPTSDLPFIATREAADRFVAVRRWAREHGLPRFLFVRSPLEVKPFYLDLDSPPLVDLFVRASTRLREEACGDPLLVTEMLPGPDQAWLPDAEGERYASELRLIVVDRTADGRQPAVR